MFDLPMAATVPRLVTMGDTPRFFLHVSRNVRLKRGQRQTWVSFQVVNNGEDPHDAAIRRVGESRILSKSGLVQPISRTRKPGRFRVRLRPGRYVVFCTLRTGGSHAGRGMRMTFTVSR